MDIKRKDFRVYEEENTRETKCIPSGEHKPEADNNNKKVT